MPAVTKSVSLGDASPEKLDLPHGPFHTNRNDKIAT
jgi:hypothetical protein